MAITKSDDDIFEKPTEDEDEDDEDGEDGEGEDDEGDDEEDEDEDEDDDEDDEEEELGKSPEKIADLVSKAIMDGMDSAATATPVGNKIYLHCEDGARYTLSIKRRVR